MLTIMVRHDLVIIAIIIHHINIISGIGNCLVCLKRTGHLHGSETKGLYKRYAE